MRTQQSEGAEACSRNSLLDSAVSPMGHDRNNSPHKQFIIRKGGSVSRNSQPALQSTNYSQSKTGGSIDLQSQLKQKSKHLAKAVVNENEAHLSKGQLSRQHASYQNQKLLSRVENPGKMKINNGISSNGISDPLRRTQRKFTTEPKKKESVYSSKRNSYSNKIALKPSYNHKVNQMSTPLAVKIEIIPESQAEQNDQSDGTGLSSKKSVVHHSDNKLTEIACQQIRSFNLQNQEESHRKNIQILKSQMLQSQQPYERQSGQNLQKSCFQQKPLMQGLNQSSSDSNYAFSPNRALVSRQQLETKGTTELPSPTTQETEQERLSRILGQSTQTSSFPFKKIPTTKNSGENIVISSTKLGSASEKVDQANFQKNPSFTILASNYKDTGRKVPQFKPINAQTQSLPFSENQSQPSEKSLLKSVQMPDPISERISQFKTQPTCQRPQSRQQDASREKRNQISTPGLQQLNSMMRIRTSTPGTIFQRDKIGAQPGKLRDLGPYSQSQAGLQYSSQNQLCLKQKSQVQLGPLEKVAGLKSMNQNQFIPKPETMHDNRKDWRLHHKHPTKQSSTDLKTIMQADHRERDRALQSQQSVVPMCSDQTLHLPRALQNKEQAPQINDYDDQNDFTPVNRYNSERGDKGGIRIRINRQRNVTEHLVQEPTNANLLFYDFNSKKTQEEEFQERVPTRNAKSRSEFRARQIQSAQAQYHPHYFSSSPPQKGLPVEGKESLGQDSKNYFNQGKHDANQLQQNFQSHSNDSTLSNSMTLESKNLKQLNDQKKSNQVYFSENHAKNHQATQPENVPKFGRLTMVNMYKRAPKEFQEEIEEESSSEDEEILK